VSVQRTPRIVLAATGASGAIYLQRLLHYLGRQSCELHLLFSDYGRQVVKEEIGELLLPANARQYNSRSMNAPFVSGSTAFDAMVICPCSMGTLARIAAGTSESAILRAADVFLKERRGLILVPRETPLNLIHARNLVTVLEAGADVIPAMPSFYSRPDTIQAVVDTVVWRIVRHLGFEPKEAYRWKDEPPGE